MKNWSGRAVRAALVLMEAMWAYALVAFLVALTVGGGEPSFFGVLVVVAASFAISRVLQGSAMDLGVLRLWGVGLSILVFYAVVRVDFYSDLRFWDFAWADQLFNNTEATLEDDATAVIGVPLLLIFWIRGVLRGQEWITFEDIVASFGIGVIVIAFVEVFGVFVDELPRGVELIAVPYIAVGLLTIGLAHAARARDEFNPSFTSVWLTAVGGGILLLAFLVSLFVLIDFDTARDGLEAFAFAIGWVIAGIFYLVALPILFLVEQMFYALQWFIDLYGGTDPNPDEAQPLPEEEPPPPEEQGRGLPGWAELMVRILIAGGLAGALAIGLALLFNRFRRVPPPDEQKESTYEEGRLGADLGNLVSSLLGRFRPVFPAGRNLDPARRLYFEMLQAAANRGVERRPTETPLDIAPRLNQTFAAPTPGEITGVFDDVRYGRMPVPPEEVRRLREDWERLKG
jgi:Domain of unknown function (DUF4129)